MKTGGGIACLVQRELGPRSHLKDWCRFISSLRGVTEPRRSAISTWKRTEVREEFLADSSLKWGNSSSSQELCDLLSSRTRECVWDDAQLSCVDGKPQARQRDGHRESAPCKMKEDLGVGVGVWSKLSEGGRVSESVQALELLVQKDEYVPDSVFYRVLKGCIASKDLVAGRRLHALALKAGYVSNTFLANNLIRMYASQGRLDEATAVFDALAAPSKKCMWASIILAHAENGEHFQAIKLYEQMRRSNVDPDSHVVVAVLKACVRAADLATGKQVHADWLGSGTRPSLFVGSSLVGMYVKCGSLDDARLVFDSLPERDVVIWTAMIAGYANQGLVQEALTLYVRMQEEGFSVANHFTFVCLLKACASAGALREGKQLHSHIQERGLEADVFVGSILVEMYAKCGTLEDARRLFDRLPTKDTATWNAMIGGYARHGYGQEAISLYASMQQVGLSPADQVTVLCLLKACASIRDLDNGKELISQLQVRGLEADMMVGSGLVNMYVKCGSLDDAQRVFDNLPTRDVVTWTAIIAGYVEHGRFEEALSLYSSMEDGACIQPDQVTFVCLLRACAGVRALNQGRLLHLKIRDRELETDLVVSTSLIDMYAKCGSLEEAYGVFDKVNRDYLGIWNTMITGHMQHGDCQGALALYARMRQEGKIPDPATFVCLLQACASTGALHDGKELHSEIQGQGMDVDMAVGNSLINMYAKCGSLEDARRVFDKLPSKDVITWTTIIAGYAHHGLGEEALSLYEDMLEEGLNLADEVTFACLLKACANVGDIRQGQKLHSEIQKRGLEGDVVVGTSLVEMYLKHKKFEHAQRVFDRLCLKSVATWNAMITGFLQHGFDKEVLNLYARMQHEAITAPDHVTYLSILKACSRNGNLRQGQELHSQLQHKGLEADLAIGSSLVDMYAKCGSVEDARRVFDRLPTRDAVTWSSLIAGYAQQGLGQEALALYKTMQQEDLSPADPVTYVSLLRACASVGALHLGMHLHAEIRERGHEVDVVVGNSLVDMYAKCGSLHDARRVFDRLPKPDVVTWTALITGYAQHCGSHMAIQCFEEMVQHGVEPTDVTFTCLLVACSHEGLVNRAQQYFKTMVEDHGISPSVQHYSCMVDILGRSGHLDEAEMMLTNLPSENPVGWRTLLSACKIHGDIERGQRCFDHLVELEPEHSAAYTLLASTYATAGRWRDAQRIEDLRIAAGASKKPARAWIEVNKRLQTFIVGEERDDISSKLKSMNLQLVQQGGHVPHTRLVLKPVSETEKEDALCGHAEKLALAYGLLNTADGSTLRVTKNLRMCNDCHNGTKILSRIEKREIIVRDDHRVHHFVNGICSCGDAL